jgi:MFS family permease
MIIFVFIPESLPSQNGTNTGSEESNVIPFRQAVVRIGRDTTFVLFCLSTLLIAIAFMQGMSTLPIYIRQSGFSNLEFGLLMSVNGFLIFLLQLPMTHWLIRFDAMLVVIAGGILIAIGFGLCALSIGFAYLAMTVAIWTLGEILQAPFKHSIVTDMAPVDLRARYLGLFSMCYGLAMTIGAPLGGEVLSRFGATVLWSGTFVIAITAVAFYCALRQSITRRIALASDAIDRQVTSGNPVPVASPP